MSELKGLYINKTFDVKVYAVMAKYVFVDGACHMKMKLNQKIMKNGAVYTPYHIM